MVVRLLSRRCPCCGGVAVCDDGSLTFTCPKTKTRWSAVVASAACVWGKCGKPLVPVGPWLRCKADHVGWVDDGSSPVSVATGAGPRLASEVAAEFREAAITRERAQLPLSLSEVAVEAPRRKPITGLSPSSAGVLLQCPRRYEFAKVLGLPEPTGAPAVGGTLVHKILEVLSEFPVPQRTAEMAKRIANELWGTVAKPEGQRPTPALIAPTKDVDDLRKDLASLALDREGVAEFLGKAKRSVAAGVEAEREYRGEVAHRELDVSGTTVGGVPFRGRVDRTNRHPEGLDLVDYKSGKVDVQKNEDQLLWYGPAVEQVTGEKVTAAILAYVGDEPLLAHVDLRKTGAAVARLGRAWEDLHRFEGAATRAELPEPYPADPSPLCGWCPFFDRCPEGSKKLVELWAWMRGKDGEVGPAPAGWPKGWGPVPAKATVDSWPVERREAWKAAARRGELLAS